MPLTLVEAVIVAVSLLDDVCVFVFQSCGALAHPIRRRVASILLDCGVLRRDELAERIAADGSIPQNDPELIEIVLYHHHLPKLDQERLIDYDRRSGDVTLWEDPATVHQMLEIP